MARKVKLGFRIFIFLLFLLLLFNLELIVYGVLQGYGQLSIILKARPIQEIYEDENTHDSLRSKLSLVDSVRKFAILKLSLRETENYQSLYDQKGQPIMFVVTGCMPYSFEPKTWSFPVVGQVPYKGFFNLRLAIKERDKLKDQGWDSSVRTAGAWSTLGWFKDPILSEMLNRSKGDLANVIIHELSHGTIFVKDKVEFNENLATFIGDVGAENFLREQYGDSSEELKNYINEQRDERIFVSHILNSVERLKKLYKSFSSDMNANVKEIKKKELINEVVTEIENLELTNRGKYNKLFEDKMPNNTYFMSFLRYQSNQDSLNNVLKVNHNNSLKSFILSLK